MAYNPVTDFLALIRNSSAGAQIADMPGLDYVVAALARAGLIKLYVGQTRPLVNQSTTAWFKPAQPSYTAEGLLYLWNTVSAAYELATPALWAAIFAPATVGYVFQSVITPAQAIDPGASLVAVQRIGPASTVLTLPNLAAQFLTGRRLQIVDFSTSVVNHIITLTTPDGATIMRYGSYQLLSRADSAAGVSLQPSPDLNSWVIAP